MKNRVAATILSASVGLIVMLAAVGAVLIAILAAPDIRNPLLRAISISAQLVFGAGLLVGSVYIATQFAARVTGKSIDS